MNEPYRKGQSHQQSNSQRKENDVMGQRVIGEAPNNVTPVLR